MRRGFLYLVAMMDWHTRKVTYLRKSTVGAFTDEGAALSL
jgi:hypothetical protein